MLKNVVRIHKVSCTNTNHQYSVVGFYCPETGEIWKIKRNVVKIVNGTMILVRFTSIGNLRCVLILRIMMIAVNVGRTGMERSVTQKDIDELKSEIDKLKIENKALKYQLQDYKNAYESIYRPESAENAMQKTGLYTEEEIQNLIMAARQSLENVCDYEPQINEDEISHFNYESVKRFAEEMNYKKRNKELQNQHQQDCIRINDLRTAYLVTVDELAKLREQFGIGR